MSGTVLVTGADGFVGKHTVRALTQRGWHVRLAQRSGAGPGLDVVSGLDLGPSTDWSAALDGVQTIVHLAARAHRGKRIQQREQHLYASINVDGTLKLARDAIKAGVRHFIFLSSIAVNGSTTDGRQPFSERDLAAPDTVYGRSKSEAERGLAELAARGQMSVTAIRAPMIYGPGAQGNFGRLAAIVRQGFPLPFGAISNRRAFLGIDNLNAFILARASEAAPSPFEMFLVADDEQVSTPDFMRKLAAACHRPARLFPIPRALLRLPLRHLGLDAALLGSLQIDTTKARATGWRCVKTLDEGLHAALSATP
jgi:UDP-glucose 4-epimerase